MALSKDSGLPVAAALTGAEIVAVVQGGSNKQTTAQQIADLGAGGGAIPGSGYAQYLAASLEPDALEEVQMHSFSYAVGAAETKLLIASWQTRLGSSGRFEQRNPERYFPLRGQTIAGTGPGSGALILDPTAVSYADPWATYYGRLEQLHALPTRYIPLTAAGQAVPLLPGPYGAILTQVTNFNFAWTVMRFGGPAGAGFNLMDEESDAAVQRVGGGLRVPISKRTAGELETSAASSSTGGAALSGVAMVLLPSDWSLVADPVAAAYDFRDDFMGSVLDTGVWTRAQSLAGNVEIDTTYQWCKLAGATAWGTNGLFATVGTARVDGTAMVVDIFMPRGASATGVGAVGWSAGTGHSINDFAHALNFAGGVSPGGVINVYENGTARGAVGSGWTGGCIYRVKITQTATGATYEIQGGPEYSPIGGAVWDSITPGTSSSASATLRPGATAYASTAYLSDFRVF